MPNRTRLSPAALAPALLALLLPGAGSAQQMGIFFDVEGTTCASTIEPFGPSVHAWIIAFPGSAQVNGAVLSLRLLPPGLHVVPDSEKYPLRSSVIGGGSLEDQVDVIFQPLAGQPCRTGVAGIPIVEFDLAYLCTTCGPRSDLQLHLTSAAGDTIAGASPLFRVCDPDDPTHHPGNVYATPLDAYLNCTANCGCTTALEPATWGHVKTLYRDR